MAGQQARLWGGVGGEHTREEHTRRARGRKDRAEESLDFSQVARAAAPPPGSSRAELTSRGTCGHGGGGGGAEALCLALTGRCTQAATGGR